MQISGCTTGNESFSFYDIWIGEISTATTECFEQIENYIEERRGDVSSPASTNSRRSSNSRAEAARSTVEERKQREDFAGRLEKAVNPY